MLVEWDRRNPEKPKISDRFHSDICDAVLYAYRRCLQWLHVAAPAPAPRINSPEWIQLERARQESEFEAQCDAEFRANKEHHQEHEWTD